MGQRFQIITNAEGRIKVYHCQWLWGDYAIRRIGTAIRNYINYGKDGYRPFEDFLSGSFYGKLDDMNSFNRYQGSDAELDDNAWIVGKKKYANFDKFLKILGNNDGYFYVEFSEGGINNNEKGGIKGHCFIYDDFVVKDLAPFSAEGYMQNYTVTEGFTKKQRKEYQDGLKTFEKLKVIKPIKRVMK